MRKREKERDEIAKRQSGSLTSSCDFPRCSHRCTLCTCVHASITRSPLYASSLGQEEEEKEEKEEEEEEK